MNVLRAFAENHAHPRGWLGKLVAWRLARVNGAANAWTLGLLDIQPTDRVLEIGFGPGLGIASAAALAHQGSVAGIESSDVMLEAARKRNAAAIAARRVELELRDASTLPYPDGEFDRLFAVNVIYFMTNPAPCLREWRRVLKPGGRIALFLEAKEKLERSGKLIEGIYTLYRPEEVVQFLCQAGFARVDYEAREFAYGRGICVLGAK